MSQPDSSEIDEYIRRVVDAAPPLTAEQRAKLRALLHSQDGRDTDRRIGD